MNNYCVNHPDRQAVGECSQCEKPLCILCAGKHHGKIYCSDCIGFAPDSRPDWEKPLASGHLSAFFNTWKKIITKPGEFFSQLSGSGGLFYPVAFATIINTLALWSYLALGFFIYPDKMQALLVYGRVAAWVIVVFVPFFMILDIFIRSFILHLFVFVCGGRKGLEATLRTVAYTSAVQIFLIIPYLGAPVAGIWRLALTILGISHLHKISSARAVLAVLFPIILAIVLVIILVFTFGSMEFLKSLPQKYPIKTI